MHRFMGAQLEAAASLFSVLSTESAAGNARAAAAMRAQRARAAAAAAAAPAPVEKKRGGGGEGKTKKREEEEGEEEEKTKGGREEEQQKGKEKGCGETPGSLEVVRLPLPVLIAAARSLRILYRSATSMEGSLASTAGGRGRTGMGGPSAVRLARYLTRQCDK